MTSLEARVVAPVGGHEASRRAHGWLWMTGIRRSQWPKRRSCPAVRMPGCNPDAPSTRRGAAELIYVPAILARSSA
jgi:hypothetical protein